ncbi:MAG: glycosyltransferase, partial [Candidatus Omnitrophica bacterium]|nr:glycosyltransferase [Candidatus Omnitrophota bacterium]
AAPAPPPSLTVVVPENVWSGRQISALENVAHLSHSQAVRCRILVIGDAAGSRLVEALIKAGAAPGSIKIAPRNPSRNPLYDALRTGSQETTDDLLLYVEPNLNLPGGELESLLERWRRFPADVVVASRRHGKNWKLKPLMGRILSNVYHTFVRKLFFMDAGDAQTGVKLFRVRTLRQVLPRLVLKEYALDLEVLAVAHHLGHSIHIEPITVEPDSPQRRAYVLDIFHLVMDTLSIGYRMRVLHYYDRPQIPPAQHPAVSVVIPCVAPNRYLTECLRACERLDYPADKIQIIVLPNEADAVPFPKVTVIPTGPCGPGKKRDSALAHCTGEIVAFIDDDTAPETDWLKNAMRCFEDDRIAAVGGPAVTPATDSLRQAASGAVYSSWLVAGNQNYRYAPAPGRWVDDYPSCNLFIRRSVLSQAGGFDTSYWPGEDTILCTKITHELNQKIWYDPDVVVYHHRRAMFGGHLKQIRRYAEHRGFSSSATPPPL